MKEVVIGKTSLPYTVKESGKAKYKRIEVTPGKIEVIVPRGTLPEAVTGFVEGEKNKIFKSFLEIENTLSRQTHHDPMYYLSGAKVLYRGRMELLHVTPGPVSGVEIEYKNGFFITCPGNLMGAGKEAAIRRAFTAWLHEQITADVNDFAGLYAEKLGVSPGGIRIKEQKHLWGSCGKDRIININWQLVRFPVQVLEYVAVHELCHLKYRNHSHDFWMLLGSLLPDYPEYKKILEDCGDYGV